MTRTWSLSPCPLWHRLRFVLLKGTLLSAVAPCYKNPHLSKSIYFRPSFLHLKLFSSLVYNHESAIPQSDWSMFHSVFPPLHDSQQNDERRSQSATRGNVSTLVLPPTYIELFLFTSTLPPRSRWIRLWPSNTRRKWKQLPEWLFRMTMMISKSTYIVFVFVRMTMISTELQIAMSFNLYFDTNLLMTFYTYSRLPRRLFCYRGLPFNVHDLTFLIVTITHPFRCLTPSL